MNERDNQMEREQGIDEVLRPREAYCDFCDNYGHTFSQCPKRDDAQ